MWRPNSSLDDGILLLTTSLLLCIVLAVKGSDGPSRNVNPGAMAGASKLPVVGSFQNRMTTSDFKLRDDAVFGLPIPPHRLASKRISP